MYRRSLFDRFAKTTSRFTGHPIAFAVAAAIIGAWIVAGPIFRFSDTWQLVINTATTIVTFLMVFLIQNTQNRESAAIQLKLDELIRASRGAHNGLLDLEELSESELETFREEYLHMAEEAREEIRRGKSDVGTPGIEFPPDEQSR
jgi:low affinity Fe/Cu permease